VLEFFGPEFLEEVHGKRWRRTLSAMPLFGVVFWAGRRKSAATFSG
jgi:hypothetical protein